MSSEASLPDLWPGPFLATVGVFDGLHSGHLEIIRLLCEEARRKRLPAVLFTFHPRPVAVLSPGIPEELLTPPPRKWRLLAETGIERVCVLSFTRTFSELSAEEFLSRFLGAGRGLQGLWVGHDFRFGHRREGDAALLSDCAQRYGFTFTKVRALLDQGEPISASRIRRALRAGEITHARRLLGRWPDLEGTVVRGRGAGARLLVPTANLELPPGVCLPATGVYAGFAEWDGRPHPAVMNLGRRPTLTDARSVVPEVHVLGFEGDLRGRTLLFELRERLREERNFNSLNELKDQIKGDIEAARLILSAQTPAESHLVPTDDSC